MKRFGHRGGLTLVELLVVIGILSIVAAVAVPTFIRYSATNRGELQRGARGLQEMIKAAKIYATTYNTEAALVYTVNQATDSVTGAPIRYIDGYAVVRQLTRDEAATFDVTQAITYTPIQEADGRFQRMPEGLSLAYMTENGPGTSNATDLYIGNGGSAQYAMGLQSIQLVDITADPTDPSQYAIVPRSYVDPNGGNPDPLGFPPSSDVRFPAHVFNRSGNLEAPAGKQRFTLTVTPAPSEPEDVRYVLTADGAVPPPARETLELYATLGRVKLES